VYVRKFHVPDRPVNDLRVHLEVRVSILKVTPKPGNVTNISAGCEQADRVLSPQLELDESTILPTTGQARRYAALLVAAQEYRNTVNRDYHLLMELYNEKSDKLMNFLGGARGTEHHHEGQMIGIGTICVGS